MAVDDASRTLYVTDTGADRVVAVEMDTGYWGYDAKPIFPVYSSPAATFNYSVWHGSAPRRSQARPLARISLTTT